MDAQNQNLFQGYQANPRFDQGILTLSRSILPSRKKLRLERNRRLLAHPLIPCLLFHMWIAFLLSVIIYHRGNNNAPQDTAEAKIYNLKMCGMVNRSPNKHTPSLFSRNGGREGGVKHIFFQYISSVMFMYFILQSK